MREMLNVYGREFTGEPAMTTKQVSEYTKFCRTSIYRFLKKRTIPAYKVIGRWRFFRSEIDCWLMGIEPNLEILAASPGSTLYQDMIDKGIFRVLPNDPDIKPTFPTRESVNEERLAGEVA